VESPVDWKQYGLDPAQWVEADLPARLIDRVVYTDIRETGRRRLADRIRLARLSSFWKTGVQLDRLGAAPRRRTETFRFAVLGDAEPGRFWVSRALFNVRGAFMTQLRDIQSRGVDFCVQLGDVVSRGSARNYLGLMQDLSTLESSVPYFTVIGNHDRHTPHGRANSELFRSVFGKTHYYFDHAGYRFISLDTSMLRLTRRQLGWLEGVLDTDLRKVVFTHVPPADLAVWKDFSGRWRGFGGFKEGSGEFLRLMSRSKVDRVYFGHIHAFGVREEGGVRYVLTGGGGSPLYPMGLQDRFHHYIVAEASPEGLRDTVHCADGRSFLIPKRGFPR
jgi:3',5'-cyclic AMP phosphodiesterase CpdA